MSKKNIITATYCLLLTIVIVLGASLELARTKALGAARVGLQTVRASL